MRRWRGFPPVACVDFLARIHSVLSLLRRQEERTRVQWLPRALEQQNGRHLFYCTTVRLRAPDSSLPHWAAVKQPVSSASNPPTLNFSFFRSMHRQSTTGLGRTGKHCSWPGKRLLDLIGAPWRRAEQSNKQQTSLSQRRPPAPPQRVPRRDPTVRHSGVHIGPPRESTSNFVVDWLHWCLLGSIATGVHSVRHGSSDITKRQFREGIRCQRRSHPLPWNIFKEHLLQQEVIQIHLLYQRRKSGYY